MESNKINISKNERRNAERDQAKRLSQLSNPQKYSMQSLKIFGYSLIFIRQIDDKFIPILAFNNQFATINTDGEIDTTPNLQIRQ